MASSESARVVLRERGIGEHLLFEREEPAAHEVAVRPLVPLGRAEGLHRAAVDRSHLVERGLGLGDLHLGYGEAALHRAVLEPP